MLTYGYFKNSLPPCQGKFGSVAHLYYFISQEYDFNTLFYENYHNFKQVMHQKRYKYLLDDFKDFSRCQFEYMIRWVLLCWRKNIDDRGEDITEKKDHVSPCFDLLFVLKRDFNEKNLASLSLAGLRKHIRQKGYLVDNLDQVGSVDLEDLKDEQLLDQMITYPEAVDALHSPSVRQKFVVSQPSTSDCFDLSSTRH